MSTRLRVQVLVPDLHPVTGWLCMRAVSRGSVFPYKWAGLGTKWLVALGVRRYRLSGFWACFWGPGQRYVAMDIGTCCGSDDLQQAGFPQSLRNFLVLIASPPNRWETKAWGGVLGLATIGTESGLGSGSRVQGPGSRPLTPNPTCGPGSVQTMRREDQVCHSHALHLVPHHQEADVSSRLASGVPREDITGLPV